MPDLVLTEPGLKLSTAKGKVEVRRGEELVLRHPLQQVDAVFLGPGIGISAGAIAELRQMKRPVVWTSERGHPLSWLAHAQFDDAGQRLRQAESVLYPAQRLAFARAIVSAKLAAIGGNSQKAQLAPDIDMLRGIEGDASRRYFRAYWQKWPAD